MREPGRVRPGGRGDLEREARRGGRWRSRSGPSRASRRRLRRRSRRRLRAVAERHAPAAAAERVRHTGSAWIEKLAFEMSKKTLPTASTLIRAWDVADVRQRHGLRAVVRGAGREDRREGLAAVERQARSSRSVVLIGAASVPATSHVTVWVDPPCTAPAVFGEVTRNGPRPARGAASCRRCSTPPSRSRAVKPEVERERARVDAGEADVVARREELREALRDGLRHRRCDRPRRAGAGVGIRVVVRICCRSGKTRVGSAVRWFSPGESYCSESSRLIWPDTGNIANSGPFVLVLFSSEVPAAPPRSFCSQL